jgi:N-acetylglutamate synthase-like GNAT family acetyltransferase
MIRLCRSDETENCLDIINDAAGAYKGVIPSDCWREPYMSLEHLQDEIKKGVNFWGFEGDGELLGVMGLQEVRDVTLIRHAYVKTACRNRGIGNQLLTFLLSKTEGSVLIGTWAAAIWAIRFYEKHGFQKVTEAEKNRLLHAYWIISARQVETSVVLANVQWFETCEIE